MANVKIDLGKLASNEGLAILEQFLCYHSFVGGVKAPNMDDVIVYKKLGLAPASDYVCVARWYRHVSSWIENVPSNLPRGNFEVPAEKADDDIDLFGDDDEGEDDVLAKKMEQMKASKEKKRPAAKSLLVIHIEPVSIDVNLDEVLKLVKQIKMEGVTWGENSTKIPLAFGIQKLQVSCTILDDLVNTNEIVDIIEELGLTEEQKELRRKRFEEDDEDYDEDDEEPFGLVQSASIVSFNKL
ncbi:bifunctional Translation elongation factor EF1B [Babesia duncani]|uniref:Bifunctional Translation elongation factor EF1B n=1 Tax=Babesia duncani TaxID=323732 RepID=A0AAD9PMQ9_9APIC|nr:bifunctional Translation elongation factor EF1B [Babesia duncani]